MNALINKVCFSRIIVTKIGGVIRLTDAVVSEKIHTHVYIIYAHKYTEQKAYISYT